jgi:signal transduction histidine kinase/DNA-binding response OmpR family regulator
VKGLALVAIPVIPLLLLSLVYFPVERRSQALQYELRHALELGQRSQDLIIAVQDARAAARKYLLTQSLEWREDYVTARHQVPAAMDGLAGSLRAHDQGAERMGELQELVDRKLVHLDAAFEVPGATPDLELGEAVLDSIRSVMEPFRTRADRVLARASTEESIFASLPPLLVAGASVLGILGGIVGAFLFSSGVSNRIMTLERNMRRLGRPGRTLLPMENSKGEIGRLALGVERADRILKSRQAELGRARSEAEAATRAKSAFLAAMSHELRTPLGAVIGFGELLEDEVAGELNERQARYVENVVSSGRHLLELINDVLDLSKVEAGRMELQLEPMDILPVLERSLLIVENMARGKDVRVELDVGERLPEVLADEGRLKQILYNLLSNAVKFTEEGGRVVLGADVDGSPPETLRIRVRDTGIGIAPEDQERIFGEFEQVDSSLARTEQGTGLGLTLVRRLTALHGGEVTVESIPGEGSTFTVRLPLAEAQTGTEDIRSHRQPEPGRLPGAPEPPETAPRVLIVEDDPWARDLLTEYLHEAGYRTLAAASGEEALQLARTERPQAITMDVLLPGRDGWEVLGELKSDQDTRGIPVFLVTVVDDQARGLELGAVACFQKPVDRQGLLSAIQNAITDDGSPPRSVLVVDDDPEARDLARGVLETEGYRVLEAGGGMEGIEVAREERPDVVVLDLLMPDLTGFDVAVVLRESPATAEIPILVWTAQDLSLAERERLNRCIEGVSVKGGKDRFLSDLRRMLGRRPATLEVP